MEQIQNFDAYIKLMRNGNYDKLFFVDKLFGEWETFLDFGCADGSQTLAIAEVFTDKQIIGYDPDEKMIQLAKENLLKSNLKNVSFTSNLEATLKKKIDILFLSSIIHEVYSYQSAESIDKFWNMVFENEFKYIVIRDMVYDEQLERRSDVNKVRKVMYYCKSKNISNKLKEFERAHGSIDNYKNLIHFLLKYLYTDTQNWPREVHENYFKLSIQKFYELIPQNYRIQYEESCTLPFLKHKWEEDFGFFVNEKIHSKFILKNTNLS